MPPDDPLVLKSLAVVDKVIKVDTPNGVPGIDTTMMDTVKKPMARDMMEPA